LHEYKDLVLPKNGDFHQAYHLNIACWGGEDRWYHNRNHMDMQLMEQFDEKFSDFLAIWTEIVTINQNMS